MLVTRNAIDWFFAPLFAAMVMVAPPASAQGTPGLFGTIEVKKTDLKPFPKWTDVLGKAKAEAEKNSGECKVTAEEKCYYRTWTRFVESIRSLDKLAQINKVNDFLNQAKYVVDEVNWQVDDYWATPGQFFSRFGDCEDYAIAKYLTLAMLGFDNDTTRVVVVQDLNLKVPHAVLAVLIDGKTWILDNQIKQVIEAEKIKHYRPVYSVNGQSWWLHRAAGS